jgi:hypothetical protein
MNNRQEPTWQPIRNLPMIADMIDSQVEEAKIQLENLLEACERPHILDDITVERTVNVFTEQQEYVLIFGNQLSKWQQEERLTAVQEKEIDRLKEQVKIWRKTLKDILAIAEELKTGTIEKVMKKSELELGIEIVTKIQEA